MSAVLSHKNSGNNSVVLAASTPSPQPEVADLLVAYLQQIGVEFVFGIPGGAIEPIYNALARSARRGGPRAVVSRHEAGAAFMADGYARETGKLGVCIATSGPGATNLITGIACAHDNNIPLLAITGLPTLPSFGKNALQESSCIGVNTLAMFGHCTSYNSLISHPDQFERKFINAVMTAQQNPGGAAHLAIPLDILRTTITHARPTYALDHLLQQRSSLIDELSVRDIRTDIQHSPRVVFLIGNGCGEAIDAIIELVELTHGHFVTTPDAKGLINPYHPAYCGVFGFGGHRSAEALLTREPDLVLAFGTGFNELISGNRCDELLGGRLIHIDESQTNLIRSPMARRHVLGRIRTVCERLIELLKEDSLALARTRRNATNHIQPAGISLHAPNAADSNATPIKPQRLMKLLSERCPRDTRFLADSGNSMVWAAHYLQLRDHRSGASRKSTTQGKNNGTSSWLRILMDFCPMGWAIGASIGIARGNPESPVVCITGDGAYLMSGQEITVAAQEKLSVLFVILNDAAYGMVKHGQRLAQAEQTAFELPQIDFRKLGEAMGIPGHIIESPQDLEALDLDEILRRPGPTILDVRIDPEEVPPMNLRMQTLGTLK